MLVATNVAVFAFLVGTGFLIVALLSRWTRWIISPLRKFPGPKERAYPLGNFPAIRSEPFLDPFKRWIKKAGEDALLIHYNVIFWRQALLVLDKEIVKLILTSPFGKESPRFTKRVQFLRDTVGEGLVTVQGVDWARHRRILQPAFNTNFLREAMIEAVPPRVKYLIQHWQPAVDAGCEIDVVSHLAALTLDVVGHVAFSHDFNALNALEEWSKQIQGSEGNKDLPLADVGDDLLKYFTDSVRINVITVLCVLLGAEKLNWYINPQVRHTRRFLDAAVEEVVAKARKDNTASRSLLHLLLHARDPELEGKVGQLSDSDIRDEVKTFMIAGHETTSSWIHWALFALVQYPDCQERLYKDVMKHAPSDKDSDITLEQTENMEFLGAFLQEVLRVFPPIGLYIRYNANEEKWHGVTIPRDTRLIVSPHLLHRHPKYWDKPDSFMPERWINVSPEEVERRRFAFVPFSAGGRSCIGQVFATMEAKLIMAHLVRAYRLVPAPSQRDAKYTFSLKGISMKAKPAFKVSLKNR